MDFSRPKNGLGLTATQRRCLGRCRGRFLAKHVLARELRDDLMLPEYEKRGGASHDPAERGG